MAAQCYGAAAVGSGADEQDTATPGSSASDATEASRADGVHAAVEAVAARAPVKNTFIHFDEEEEEQPDYRPCMSGPAHLSRMLEPAFVPWPGPACEPLGQPPLKEDCAPAFAAEPPPPTYRPPLPLLGEKLPPPPSHDAESPVVGRSSSGSQENLFGAIIKNTFIHFDEEEEQPDYRPVKSGPAKLFNTWHEEPAWLPCSDDKSPKAEEPSAPVGLGESTEGLPSKGSSGHAAGMCKPCAHIWKPGGCSKGADCGFCHLCVEDDFRRRRREKLTRLKAEKAMRRAEAAQTPAADAEEHSEGSQEEKERARPSRSDGRQLPAPVAVPPMPQCDQDAAEELAPGEVAVSYSGITASVRWAVDLRKLRSQHRCGQSRRFGLKVGENEEVPFVFFISPSGADAAEAAPNSGHGKAGSFKRSQVTGVMQIKCLDASSLAQGTLISVSFAAAGLPPRKASVGQNFHAEPVCALPPHEAAWDLAAATGQAVGCCVLRAELSLPLLPR